MNPEPIAPFVDLFVVGEAEAVLKDLLDLLRRSIDGEERRAVLRAVVQTLPGCYAPCFIRPSMMRRQVSRKHVLSRVFRSGSER